MTISGAVAAFLTAFAIFWLVGMITGDSLFAMAASLIVLAGGALFASEGAIGEILGTGYSYPYFPGFRRYIPAMAFPAYFAMTALVWKIVGERDERADGRRLDAVLVILTITAFAYTVFSYFYVWTTAAAWLGALCLLWLVFRPEGFRHDLKRLAAVAVGCVLSLIPYAYLLSKRSHTMDDVQMLVRTHAADLTRPPELISFVVIVSLVAGILLGLIKLRDQVTLFAFSLALTPIIVFNQQVVTGQSLQPIHYQVFIGNYVAGLAVVVTLGSFWRQASFRTSAASKAAFTVFAMAAIVWGFVECHYTVRILDDVNVIRDEAFPVGRRLAEIGQNDPDRHKRVVLHLGIAEADDLPTIAPQSVLWARHQHVFAGVTWQENKERYYQQLCYQGVDPLQLASSIKEGGDFVSMIALFGWGRHTDRLNSEYTPLSFREIDEEARIYGEYCSNFTPSQPGAVALDYLITPIENTPYLPELEKWYQQDEGEVYGKYVLYKLKLRP
jgi:hypothetical protein